MGQNGVFFISERSPVPRPYLKVQMGGDTCSDLCELCLNQIGPVEDEKSAFMCISGNTCKLTCLSSQTHSTRPTHDTPSGRNTVTGTEKIFITCGASTTQIGLLHVFDIHKAHLNMFGK